MNHSVATIIMAAVLALLAPARAGSLQAGLDTPLSVSLDQTPIDEVFARLGKLGGVEFDIAEDVYAFLPYGRKTRLNVSMDEISLRRALPTLLASQGLDHSLADDEVHIVPAEPLVRMARRATYEELRLLGALMTTRVDRPADSLGEALTLAGPLKGLDAPGLSQAARKAAVARANQALPATLAQWLDRYGAEADLTWYLDGQTVHFLSRRKQLDRQMQRVVSLRYQNAPIDQVLRDLAAKAHTRLQFQPGALNLLPESTQKNFTLIMADATIDQALETIAGSTGLEFQIRSDGLVVKPSVYLEVVTGSDRPRRRGRPAFVIERTIPTPGGEPIRILVLPEEVSPQLERAIRADAEKALDAIERHYNRAR